MNTFISIDRRKLLVLILAFTLLVRLVTLGAYPLADLTEGRYAEIARKMFETGNWVTPLEDYGVPFWAKPPLSTWLTALCFKLFGVNEFTARLSSFILVLAICGLTYLLARRHRDRDYALLGTFILATTALTFVTGGAVMTDAALALSSTLCMVAFWLALTGKGRLWGYLFFVGLAGGLLSKGLVPVVLTIFPIALWTLWKKQWPLVRDRLPWFSGTALCLALALPWYILAELRTPGFLNYFFIGEHFGKFLVKGWQGDLYGGSHGHPRGTIWLYWLASDLPWSIVVVGMLIKNALRPRLTGPALLKNDWFAYLAAWTVAPMLFFTLAGNVMLTYVMPGLPAFALLAALLLGLEEERSRKTLPAIGAKSVAWLVFAGVAVPVIVILLVCTPPGQKLLSRKSQKPVVAQYEALRPHAESRLVYLFERPHSAEFYTHGAAILADLNEAKAFLSDNEQNFFVIRNNNVPMLQEEPYLSRLEQVQKYKDFTLYRSRGNSDAGRLSGKFLR